MLITVLSFLLTIGVLIVVHEYGHYRVAVACNVKVLRFSVGFGRVLWSRRRGPDQTEFAVCALPLGGYVKMLDEREAAVPVDEQPRAFNRRPLWQRAAIVAAGPLANLLLAVLLYAAAHWMGIEEPKAVLSAPSPASVAERAGMRAGDWVRSWSADGVQWHDVQSLTDLRWQATQAALRGEALHLMVSDRDGRGSRALMLDMAGAEARDIGAAAMSRSGLGGPYSDPVLGEIKPGGAASAAGLRAGDRVLRVDGVAMTDGQALRERIRAAVKGGQGLPMRWTIERGGQALDVTVTPRPSAAGADGAPTVGRIEAYIGQPMDMVLVRHGFVDGLVQGGARTWDMSALTVKMMGRMLVGQASLRNLSGPLAIADYASQSVQRGLSYYLAFLAFVSVSLGVLNLLPLPILDGGHLMYYLFEGVTGRPVSDRWLDRLQRVGIALLLMMMSVALFNDVALRWGPH